MATAVVFGSTGAVGSKILDTLINTESYAHVKTISRRLPNVQSSKLEAFQEADTSKWAGMIQALSATVIFNAVGTTKATAGSIQKQWEIDHDLCVEIAKAAEQAGVKTYVFISSAYTRGFLSRNAPFSKMKIGVEDAIQGLQFDQAIILRPGFILGEREKPKAPTAEKIISNLHRINAAIQDMIGQDQKVIGRAAVTAARLAGEGEAPSKYWVLEQADIVKHGNNEPKE